MGPRNGAAAERTLCAFCTSNSSDGRRKSTPSSLHSRTRRISDDVNSGVGRRDSGEKCAICRRNSIGDGGFAATWLAAEPDV